MGLVRVEVFIMTTAMMTTMVPMGTGDCGWVVDGVGACLCDNHREVGVGDCRWWRCSAVAMKVMAMMVATGMVEVCLMMTAVAMSGENRDVSTGDRCWWQCSSTEVAIVVMAIWW